MECVEKYANYLSDCLNFVYYFKMMYYRFVRKAYLSWNALVEECVSLLKLRKKQYEHDLYLTKTTGFLKTDVFKADECIVQKKTPILLDLCFFSRINFQVLYM